MQAESIDDLRAWTKSQLDRLIRVANVAADENQVELSKKILRTIVKRPFPHTNGNRLAIEMATKPYARAVGKLIERLGNDRLSAPERYELLLPIFLAGKNEIFLYQEQSRLLDEKPTFLASSLIEATVQAQRISDLKYKIDQREQDANTFSTLVLRTHLAIAQNDLQEVKELLKGTQGQLHSETGVAEIETACHAAIPAFEFEELREAALPILQAYLDRVKATGNYPEGDLKLFKLVRRIDDYLESLKK